MKTYLIKLDTKSSFSSIPNNQVLFGAICWAIKDLYGKEKLESMLENLSNNPFVLSNVYPKNLLPKFNIDYKLLNQENINELLKKHQDKKGLIFTNIKKYNKARYFSRGVVKELLSNTLDKTTFLEDILVKTSKKYQFDKDVISIIDENISENEMKTVHEMRNSLNRMTHSTSGTDEDDKGRLFYANRTFTDQASFEFYLQTHNIDFFIPIFKYLSDTGIGKDKSVGFNQFHFSLIDEIRFENNTNYKYLISNMIPLKNEIDFRESYYDLKSSIGKVESRDYFLGEDILKREIVYITEGSVLKVNEEKSFYGDLPVVKEINGIKIYQNGLGLLI